VSCRSRRRTQAVEGERDEPMDRHLRRKLPSRPERVGAVAGELAVRKIVPDVTIRGRFGEEVTNQPLHPMLCVFHLLVSVEEAPERRSMPPTRVACDQGEGSQHRFEPIPGTTGLLSDLLELFEVARDLILVPGEQDGLDIWEVLVERGSPDAGRLGDLGHRDREEAALVDKRRRGVQDRAAHLSSVRLDCVGPELRHGRSIRRDVSVTIRVDLNELYR
jgi:hypothetical protein